MTVQSKNNDWFKYDADKKVWFRVISRSGGDFKDEITVQITPNLDRSPVMLDGTWKDVKNILVTKRPHVQPGEGTFYTHHLPDEIEKMLLDNVPQINAEIILHTDILFYTGFHSMKMNRPTPFRSLMGMTSKGSFLLMVRAGKRNTGIELKHLLQHEYCDMFGISKDTRRVLGGIGGDCKDRHAFIEATFFHNNDPLHSDVAYAEVTYVPNVGDRTPYKFTVDGYSRSTNWIYKLECKLTNLVVGGDITQHTADTIVKAAYGIIYKLI